MTEIFKFENQQVHFVGTVDDFGWIAKDVGAVLEITDTSQAVDNLDENEKLLRTIYASGQNRALVVE